METYQLQTDLHFERFYGLIIMRTFIEAKKSLLSWHLHVTVRDAIINLLLKGATFIFFTKKLTKGSPSIVMIHRGLSHANVRSNQGEQQAEKGEGHSKNPLQWNIVM